MCEGIWKWSRANNVNKSKICCLILMKQCPVFDWKLYVTISKANKRNCFLCTYMYCNLLYVSGFRKRKSHQGCSFSLLWSILCFSAKVSGAETQNGFGKSPAPCAAESGLGYWIIIRNDNFHTTYKVSSVKANPSWLLNVVNFSNELIPHLWNIKVMTLCISLICNNIVFGEMKLLCFFISRWDIQMHLIKHSRSPHNIWKYSVGNCIHCHCLYHCWLREGHCTLPFHFSAIPGCFVPCFSTSPSHRTIVSYLFQQAKK